MDITIPFVKKLQLRYFFFLVVLFLLGGRPSGGLKSTFLTFTSAQTLPFDS